MKKNIVLIIAACMISTLACNTNAKIIPTATTTAPASLIPAIVTTTEIASTPTPLATFTPLPGKVVLDFAAQLCNAQWMNGGQKFASCPDPNIDHSAGYATLLNPASENFPADTPILLTIPALNDYSALFLRYPPIKIEVGDHFHAVIQCLPSSTNCDVSFGLDYYDSNGKYHSPLAMWDQNSRMTPTTVDYDLSALIGQNVDLVLALRPNNNTPQHDIGLWIMPQVIRP